MEAKLRAEAETKAAAKDEAHAMQLSALRDQLRQALSRAEASEIELAAAGGRAAAATEEADALLSKLQAAEDAVAAFCELMPTLSMSTDGPLTINIGKYSVEGGWPKLYPCVHMQDVSEALLMKLQSKSVLQLSRRNTKDFLKQFPACKTLSEHILTYAFDHTTLLPGQNVEVNSMSVLFGFTPAVNYGYHSDAAANPSGTTSDITAIVSIGPGSSDFFVAGAPLCSITGPRP